MHDKDGERLKVGDTILIEAIITELGSGDDHCNVNVETTAGRRPDGMKERISVNTGVVTLIESAIQPDSVVIGRDMPSDNGAGLYCDDKTILVGPKKVTNVHIGAYDLAEMKASIDRLSKQYDRQIF